MILQMCLLTQTASSQSPYCPGDKVAMTLAALTSLEASFSALPLGTLGPESLFIYHTIDFITILQCCCEPRKHTVLFLLCSGEGRQDRACLQEKKPGFLVDSEHSGSGHISCEESHQARDMGASGKRTQWWVIPPPSTGLPWVYVSTRCMKSCVLNMSINCGQTGKMWYLEAMEFY